MTWKSDLAQKMMRRPVQTTRAMRENIALEKQAAALLRRMLHRAGPTLDSGQRGEDHAAARLFLKKRADAWARPSTEYDVIAALPDSVMAQPLGLVEERDPHGTAAPPPRPAAPDLRQAKRAPLPATLPPQLATLVSSVPLVTGS